MIEQIEFFSDSKTTEEILLDFSKKKAIKQDRNALILFGTFFLNHLFYIASQDSKVDNDSTYIGIQNSLDRLIEAKITFKNGLEFKFTRKEVSRDLFILISFEFNSEELKTYTYNSPRNIYELLYVYKISDRIAD